MTNKIDYVQYGNTNSESTSSASSSLIDRAESRLAIRFPFVVRTKLIENNGFEWGGFRFFGVFDHKNKKATKNDIWWENMRHDAGWIKRLPRGFVAIASNDDACLVLSTQGSNKEIKSETKGVSRNIADGDKSTDLGKIFIFHNNQPDGGELLTFAENELDLRKYLDSQDISLNEMKKTVKSFRRDGEWDEMDAVARMSVYEKSIPELEKTYEDFFVAKMSGVQRSNGKYMLSCAWTGYIPTVMPTCDYVMIVTQRLLFHEIFVIRQKKLLEIIDGHFEQGEGYVVTNDLTPDVMHNVWKEAAPYAKEYYYQHIAGLNVPAKEKYFIKYLISTNKSNEESLDNAAMLQFYHGKYLKPGSGMVYCSKVNPGQTLMGVIQRELNQMLGRHGDEFELLDISDDGTDFDRYGNELTRYKLTIEVSFVDVSGRRFSGLHGAKMGWVKI